MDFRHLFHAEATEGRTDSPYQEAPVSEDDDPVQAFYSLCEQNFHKTASALGYARNGIIRVPELMPSGKQAVLSYLKNKAYQLRYGENPDDYYYIILSLCIQAGTVLAFRWQNDYASLQADGVGELLTDGPSAAAAEIFSDILSLDRHQANNFFRKIYTHWRTLISPYWDLKNSRDFAYFSMLAAFQLGVSLVLDQYSN